MPKLRITKLPGAEADRLLLIFAKHKMRQRLTEQREKGFRGWQDLGCTNEGLLERLKKNLDKGDLVDVLNLAAMMLVREQLYGDSA